MKGLIISFLVLLAFIGIMVIKVITLNNTLVRQVNTIEAKFKDNQQIYSSIRIKIEQAGLVANEYADQVIRAFNESISNRYGGGGVKGAMLWIHEQNPNIDPSVYTKIQQLVEGEFGKFEANQTTLLDMGRTYKNTISTFPNNIIASFLGYDKEKIEPYMTILISNDAKQDYSTGTMTSPNTFGKPKQ